MPSYYGAKDAGVAGTVTGKINFSGTTSGTVRLNCEGPSRDVDINAPRSAGQRIMSLAPMVRVLRVGKC